MEVELTEETLDDLCGIYKSLLVAQPDDPMVAITTVTRLQTEIIALRDLHQIHPPGRVPGTRELSVTAYIAPYMLSGDKVIVLRILHGKRMEP